MWKLTVLCGSVAARGTFPAAQRPLLCSPLCLCTAPRSVALQWWREGRKEPSVADEESPEDESLPLGVLIPENVSVSQVRGRPGPAGGCRRSCGWGKQIPVPRGWTRTASSPFSCHGNGKGQSLMPGAPLQPQAQPALSGLWGEWDRGGDWERGEAGQSQSRCGTLSPDRPHDCPCTAVPVLPLPPTAPGQRGSFPGSPRGVESSRLGLHYRDHGPALSGQMQIPPQVP